MNDTANQASKNPNYVLRVWVPFFVTLAVALISILYGNRVYDYVAARSFTPSEPVKAVGDSLKLTGVGHDIFYASKPAIQSAQAFNESCSSTERTAAILGCYSKRHIYMYDVTNPELVSAENVTGAHEMLHGAYERLNFYDRGKVDDLLNAEYKKLATRPELAKLMSYYEKAEPHDLTNELHSILGTTVVDLSPELEAYYARYFTDRKAVAAMNQAYNNVFADVEQRSRDLVARARTLKESIDSTKQSYANETTQLEADIASFNERASSGYYTTRSAFNAALGFSTISSPLSFISKIAASLVAP